MMLARVVNRGVWWVVAAAALLPLLLALPQFSQEDEEADLCNAWGDDQRFSVIREDVLSKLSALLPFNFTSHQQWPSEEAVNSSRTVEPGLMAAYEALSKVLEEDEPASCSAEPGRGRGTPAFAKRISLFFPVNDSASYSGSTEREQHHKHEDGGHSNSDTDSDGVPPTQYTFTFKPALPSQPLYSAELRLFKRIVSKCDDVFENVEVFYVRRQDGEEMERLFVTSKNMELVHDEYNSFDVLEAVNKWAEIGLNDTLELEVVVNCPFSIANSSFSPPSIEFVRDNGTAVDSEVDDSRPQLVVATITEDVATQLRRRRRKRRQIVDSTFCKNNPTAIHCCIRHLVVDFHLDLRLPWILHPQTFTPNYCQGLCPVPFAGGNYLRHSIQQFYQTNEIGGGPCCTIYEMDSLLMMIRDPRTEEVVFADVPNMEITSCGCVD